MSSKKRVLMVCLGNSCRSPIAEAIFATEIKRMGIEDDWDVDSAAVLDYHVGNSPEPRAQAVLINKGITDYNHKARKITEVDFYTFDWILGMDYYVMTELFSIQPPNSKAVIELLGKYHTNGEINIRDPLFDNDSSGFEETFDISLVCILNFLDLYKEAHT
ncbi:low molecular weight phosphotyrosine protein phosphatase-like [Prorops nasuta]|uniref:low molecular weight phosphotyrosine protein phosphatase-like n=1 Tax=Prorops nasuta TaxID=863751 RepID=UPI0034D00FD7